MMAERVTPSSAVWRWRAIGPGAALAIGALIGCSDPTPHGFVNASSLNCRSQPSTRGKISKQFASGERINTGETVGGWTKVAGADCWVSAKYLSPTLPAQAAAKAIEGDGARRARSTQLASLAKSAPSTRRTEVDDDDDRPRKKKKKRRWRRR